MTLPELLHFVDSVYPDGMVKRYFDAPTVEHGDTLAAFIVRELSDTFDATATEAEQLLHASVTIETAAMELQLVSTALAAAIA